MKALSFNEPIPDGEISTRLNPAKDKNAPNSSPARLNPAADEKPKAVKPSPAKAKTKRAKTPKSVAPVIPATAPAEAPKA